MLVQPTSVALTALKENQICEDDRRAGGFLVPRRAAASYTSVKSGAAPPKFKHAVNHVLFLMMALSPVMSGATMRELHHGSIHQSHH